jgi:hypothetical protein
MTSFIYIFLVFSEIFTMLQITSLVVDVQMIK